LPSTLDDALQVLHEYATRANAVLHNYVGQVASNSGAVAFVDIHLSQLPPLPANPRRAYATLHTDSNACYDMALLVFLLRLE
jgi:hypothetical protein